MGCESKTPFRREMRSASGMLATEMEKVVPERTRTAGGCLNYVAIGPGEAYYSPATPDARCIRSSTLLASRAVLVGIKVR